MITRSGAARLAFGCAFAPGPHTVEHIALAESLGYRHAWLYDSPALYLDLWATLARAAERTDRLGLGTAVMVPRLRHVLATASAIVTVHGLSGGRLTVGVGSGLTAARTLGLKPMRWSEVAAYVGALRRLLRGETVEWDGRAIQLMYDEGHLDVLPVEVPFLFGAEGPKGLAAAREHADGVITIRANPGPFARSARLVTGTVLEDGEPPTSDRAWEAAGHAAATAYHVSYEFGSDMSGLPNADAWRAYIDALPEAERHLLLHKGHVTTVSEHDARFIPRETVAQLTFTGTVDQLAARCRRLAARGITDVIFQPAGPDIPRELEAFARVAAAVAADAEHAATAEGRTA
jgi:5,10-methylenetetrahydromethanopterin reductase